MDLVAPETLVAYALKLHGHVEILHEGSGVRVGVRTFNEGYSLSVRPAELDVAKGQRHRARSIIADTCWRLYDSDLGYSAVPEDPVPADAKAWGYTVHRGDRSDATEAALSLLGEIAGLQKGFQVVVDPVL